VVCVYLYQKYKGKQLSWLLHSMTSLLFMLSETWDK